MGQSIAKAIPLCSCLEEEDEAVLERTEALQKGATFLRKGFMSLTSQKLHCALSESHATVRWRVEKDSKSWIPGAGGDEYGEVNLLEVSKIRASGKTTMEILSKKDDSVLMELSAEDVATRDAWVLGLNEILDRWKADPGSKPLSVQLRATDTSDKTAYYEQRQADLKAREKERNERKMKYMQGGANMKHTAQAMLNRPAPAK